LDAGAAGRVARYHAVTCSANLAQVDIKKLATIQVHITSQTNHRSFNPSQFILVHPNYFTILAKDELINLIISIPLTIASMTEFCITQAQPPWGIKQLQHSTVRGDARDVLEQEKNTHNMS
jgi:hypothetical protein